MAKDRAYRSPGPLERQQDKTDSDILFLILFIYVAPLGSCPVGFVPFVQRSASFACLAMVFYVVRHFENTREPYSLCVADLGMQIVRLRSPKGRELRDTQFKIGGNAWSYNSGGQP